MPTFFFFFFALYADEHVFFSSAEVAYTIRVESERKKLNLPSRVIFTQSSTNEYESKGTVELKGQGTKSCVTRDLRLQVQQLKSSFTASHLEGDIITTE